MTLDTLVAAKALERAGMENGQAEAVATVIRDATAEQATKADMEALRVATKADMEALRVATKADMEALRVATKADLDAFKLSTKADMDALRLATKADLDAFKLSTKADLNAVEGRLRGELYKALWAFGLGIIGTHAVVIGAAFSIALWLWPPGAS